MGRRGGGGRGGERRGREEATENVVIIYSSCNVCGKQGQTILKFSVAC